MADPSYDGIYWELDGNGDLMPRETPLYNAVISSVGGIAGTWDDSNLTDQTDFTENVRGGVTGGLGWIGGYDLDAPDEPSVGAVVENPTSVEVTITVTDQSVYTYARHRGLEGGAWSAENPAFRVQGDGVITITGLDENDPEEITFYSKFFTTSPATSDWTSPIVVYSGGGGGSSTVADDAYFIVQRIIDGTPVRYIEQLSTRFIDGDITPEEAFFVDSGLSYRGVPADRITGLSHLEGETVSVLADGNVVTGLVVTTGAIDLPFEASIVHVGLPYTCILETLDYDLQANGSPTIHNKNRNVVDVTIKLKDTRALNIGTDSEGIEEIIFPMGDDPNEPAPLFSGDKDISLNPSTENEAVVYIENSEPLPINVLSIISDVEIGDV